jgi:hypothetical protein
MLARIVPDDASESYVNRLPRQAERAAWWLRGSTALAWLLASSVALGHTGSPVQVAASAVDAAATTTETGTVEQLTVRQAGSLTAHWYLRRGDGSGIELRGWGQTAPTAGESIAVTGRVNGDALFVDTMRAVPSTGAQKAAARPGVERRIEGTLELIHADDFKRGSSWWIYSVVDAAGHRSEIDFPGLPAELRKGMRIAVTGITDAAGAKLQPLDVEILSEPPHAKFTQKVAGTSQVLMVLLKFADSATTPYTVAQAQATLSTDTWSVASFYRENSYGSHSLNGTVTNWLTASFNTPTSCNYIAIENEANRLAQLSGYNLSQFSKIVYVFPLVSACGWSGLGELGGAHAWINQALAVQVVGHELGHTFGLGHASAVVCNTPSHRPIDGPCTKSEYGDPAEIMGNSRAAHFNAAHKAALNYLPAGAVLTHKTGTTSYTLSPIESSGPAPLAVKILSAAMRTYWIEFRQPLGFDQHVAIPTGVTTGAYVHIGGDNEYDCDTCVLDMTSASTSFADAALPAGQSFVDTATGTTISVQGAAGGVLTVSVATPTRPTFGDVPPTYGAYSHIEAVNWSLVDRGCSQSPPLFCPNAPVTRADFATMLERAEHGTNFAYAATGAVFADVPASHPAAGYIEQLYRDGLTKGCAQNPLRFCPDDAVRRWEAAIFLVRARHGGAFVPGAATGTVFADELPTDPTASWAEQLYRDNITQGCLQNPRRFCPMNTVTRADAAIFLQRAYYLPSPPP